MDFNDTPEEAKFRAEVREWLSATLPKDPRKVKQAFRPSPNPTIGARQNGRPKKPKREMGHYRRPNMAVLAARRSDR